jgi:DNA-binding MarR family transcriptional regulator
MQTNKQVGNINLNKKLDIKISKSNIWSQFGPKKQKYYVSRELGPIKLIHTLLFVIENIQGSRQRKDLITSPLRFFIYHKSGLHLLLLLLNAHYNKTPAGRMPGWSFGMLLDRVEISNRSLRMLLKDAMSEKLIKKIPGRRDKRCKVYMLTKNVIIAWETLSKNLDETILNKITSTDCNDLANMNYSKMSD